MHKNGNPRGYYWDDALNDERRVGKEIAELYCKKAWTEDWDTESSTSDSSSDYDHRTNSYEPSDFGSYSEASIPRSRTGTPSLCQDHFHHIEATAVPQCRTRSDHGEGEDVVDLLEKELVDKDLITPQLSIAGRAENKVSAEQVILFLQYGLS